MRMVYLNNVPPFRITKPKQLLKFSLYMYYNQRPSVRLRNCSIIANVGTLRLNSWRTKGKASKQPLLPSSLPSGLFLVPLYLVLPLFHIHPLI